MHSAVKSLWKIDAAILQKGQGVALEQQQNLLCSNLFKPE